MIIFEIDVLERKDSMLFSLQVIIKHLLSEKIVADN
jgi:hypothetical protein